MGAALKRAVVIDQDPERRAGLSRRLGAARIDTVTEACASEVAALPSEGFGVLVISMTTPGAAELDLITRCRAQAPGWAVLVFDHVADESSAALAFAAGADDVLSVDCPDSEFEARLTLRRRQAIEAENRRRELETAFFAAANFTPVETEIVKLLLAHKGRIVTRNQLSRHIDNCDWIYGDRKFDVHITKIRKKLQSATGDCYTVRSIRSEGYLLLPGSEAQD